MPLQRDQPRAREKRRTALYACQKVIVKRRISSTAMLVPLLFMLHTSSNKFMNTLMLSGRQGNLPHLLLMLQRKGFGAGIISTLSACGFLEMLLHLPRERTGAMGPIKRMHDFEPVLFQETFRFTQGEFTEILSSMRDLEGNLLVDQNGDVRMLRRLGKKRGEYVRCWADSALMILLRRLARPAAWVDLQCVLREGFARTEFAGVMVSAARA